jgi:predicted O-methyltransferase YrrM
MEKIVWNPVTLSMVSGSYWQACTLHAGVKLGLFSALEDCPVSADELSARMQLDRRGLTILLNALAAMDLLVKTKGQFDLTDAARRFLVKSSPDYAGHMIMHHHHLVSSWSQMDVAVRTGLPVRVSASRDDNVHREAFLMGMYNMASQQAPDIVSQIFLEGRKRLLDLGGGPGTYAIHFCQHNPQLSAVVFDLPTTQPFAENVIKKHNLSDRIAFVPGDYLKDAITGRYDVVWISHILHAEGRSVCETIIAKAAKALNPGGLMLVHDFILNDSMDGPLFPALFALNMLQGTSAGQSYSESQIRIMMEKAGIGDIQRLSYCGPTESGIISGKYKC